VLRVNPTVLTALLLLAVVVWFDWYCLADLARAERVWYLSRGAWAILVVATFPLGGLAYLYYGRGLIRPGGPRRPA
jgi:hypothetical protein